MEYKKRPAIVEAVQFTPSYSKIGKSVMILSVVLVANVILLMKLGVKKIEAKEAVRLAREVTKAFGRMAEDFGNAFASFGKNLQRNMEETE